MPLYIVENDITTMHVDAIVNAANTSLLGGGGVDGCIHRAAGPQLLEECRSLHGCKTGEAKITKGYRLPCQYVIHTVGPVWHGGTHNEEELLRSCYNSSLKLAEENGCESIAFPLISAGVYGYPKKEAFRIAEETVKAYLQNHEMTVYIVIYNRSDFVFDEHRLEDIRDYIDMYSEFPDAPSLLMNIPDEELLSEPEYDEADFICVECAPPLIAGKSLKEALKDRDESFSEMLLRKIDEKGMSDVECYKKANISRKLFSKIRSDRMYKPSKPTAIAFAIALQLPLDETEELLRKAGFALSHSDYFDLIVEYFIVNGIYDISQINEALFEFDQNLLGSQ